jgi:hypothetical protein
MSIPIHDITALFLLPLFMPSPSCPPISVSVFAKKFSIPIAIVFGLHQDHCFFIEFLVNRPVLQKLLGLNDDLALARKIPV